MITDADINKMKAVFATKDDLKALSGRFDNIDKRFVSMDKRIEGLSDRVENLSKGLQNISEELVELITGGFESNEKRFERIEAEVFKSN